MREDRALKTDRHGEWRILLLATPPERIWMRRRSLASGVPSGDLKSPDLPIV